MIEDTRARVQNHQGRISRRLIGIVRDLVTGYARPDIVISFLVGLVARRHKRGRLRLAAGTQTEHVPNGAGPTLRVVPPVSGSHRRAGIATRRDELFTTVRVAPEFSPRAYAATFAALQIPPSSKLLDLTPARMLSADVFDRLRDAWTAAPDAVPRLGIVLSFERWVMLRETAVAALQPLAARGVKVEVFYEEQAWGARLDAWFCHGQLVHNVPAVVTTLTMRWQPSAIWPMVIDTLSRLVRAHTCTGELPVLMTEIAGLALSCGGAEQAATLAREALYYLPEALSATRSKALRELGAALMGQGETAAGLTHLDQAIAMAAAVKDPAIGASALCQSGLYALNHGDYRDAERRFRGAIALLAPRTRRPQLLALAHHSLAVALMHQGSGEAEYHATIALTLRPDPNSHLAEEDRILLSRLRDARPQVN
jgi:tetratricopeptide (TPR) repeat protein